MKKMLLLLFILLTACTQVVPIVPENKTTPLKPVTQNNLETLKNIFDKLGDRIEYKVRYEFSQASKTGTETIAIKGDDIKIEFILVGQSQEIYFVNSKVYMCGKQNNQMMCYEVPEADKTTVKNDRDLRKNWDKFTIEDKGTRTIAGASAICIYITETKSDYCYSKEGVPLYIKSPSKGYTTEMTAKEYSTSVKDSEFTLPATPQQLQI